MSTKARKSRATKATAPAAPEIRDLTPDEIAKAKANLDKVTPTTDPAPTTPPATPRPDAPKWYTGPALGKGTTIKLITDRRIDSRSYLLAEITAPDGTATLRFLTVDDSGRSKDHTDAITEEIGDAITATTRKPDGELTAALTTASGIERLIWAARATNSGALATRNITTRTQRFAILAYCHATNTDPDQHGTRTAIAEALNTTSDKISKRLEPERRNSFSLSDLADLIDRLDTPAGPVIWSAIKEVIRQAASPKRPHTKATAEIAIVAAGGTIKDIVPVSASAGLSKGEGRLRLIG